MYLLKGKSERRINKKDVRIRKKKEAMTIRVPLITHQIQPMSLQLHLINCNVSKFYITDTPQKGRQLLCLKGSRAGIRRWG